MLSPRNSPLHVFCNATLIGDPYIRLVNSNGTILVSNDDSCTLGSEVSYTVTSCDTYTIREGCFGSGTCSGQVSIAGTNAPTMQPTVVGSAPTQGPSVAPSFAPPTVGGLTITMCPAYSATNTNSAQQNYAVCSFTTCGGTYTLSMCSTYGGSTTSGACIYVVFRHLSICLTDDWRDR